MTQKRTSFVVAIIATIALVQPFSARAADDIVDTAVSAGSFKTLAAALQAAGLVDALKGKGPFTVFARSGRKRAGEASCETVGSDHVKWSTS